MNGVTIYEFDVLANALSGFADAQDLRIVPENVYEWLERRCLTTAAEGSAPWLRMTQRRGRRVVQVTSFVGVIRAPNGYQIEVLPKVGKVLGGGPVEARALLIAMLRCLQEFRHVRTDSAMLAAAHMPLLEIFVAEFLHAVEYVVKRGLRGDYTSRQDNLFALRGKLLIAPHLRQNGRRADRFFAEYHEWLTNRPENRLMHSALRCVLLLSASRENQRLARELEFVFADIPTSSQPRSDFRQVRLDRGMGYYADALAWAALILEEDSPLTGTGGHTAPSLLFPMEAVFEAFVAKHLRRQLARPLTLKVQAHRHHLVRHREQNWFRLKPDLVVRDGERDVLVLDTKWKLLYGVKVNGAEKYGLSQEDFYQLQAYGQSYLDGEGDVILVYPKTGSFDEALPVFEFPKTKGLRLWVLPFCLKTRALQVPPNAPFAMKFAVSQPDGLVHSS